MENPYSISKPASDAGYFVATRGGRSVQARRLLRNISRVNPFPDSISLVGERRFGKTSLLEYLKTSVSSLPNVYAIDVDISSLKPPTPDGFYAMLTQNLIEVGVLTRNHPALSYQGFLNVLAQMKKADQRLILFIDELDKVAQDRRFDKDFFNNLRSTAMRFPLAFVVASVAPLADIAYEEVSGSPFFNFFLEERLEQLSAQEVEALIFHPPSGESGVGESFHQITTLAGNHPYFLQLACGCAWDLHEDAQGDVDAKKLQRAFMMKARSQYQYIWNHCTAEEQRVLCHLTKKMQVEVPELENLVDRGYVIDGDPKRVCGQGLEDFVKAQCTAAQLPYTSTTHIDRFPSIAQTKPDKHNFDVFLCHNHEDKPTIKALAEQLSKHGISPWLDEWELRPGLPWQRILEKQIESIKSAAVFVGHQGIGPWQELEIEAFLREFVRRGCPVIPVLLPNAVEKPILPVFLKGMTWVDFRVSEPDPILQLIWGIKGKKVEPNSFK